MYASILLTSILLIIGIVNSDSDPLIKISWIIPILAFPVFGSLFYLFISSQPQSALLKRKFKKLNENSGYSLEQKHELTKELNVVAPQVYNLANYVYNTEGYPVYKNTFIKYFELGELKFKKMIDEINKAEKFIFLEYFIIEEGEMWDTLLELLEKKANEGVDVRVMYDGTCSVLHLPFNYRKKFESSKIKLKIFNPIQPVFTTVQNHRDHRKILVIDGATAFTGGVNIADEYINEKKVFGHWKDSAVMIKGEAVQTYTMLFLEMWNLKEKNVDKLEDFISSREYNARGYVIPYGDNPFSENHLGINIYMDIINNAKEYVHITSPYLVPNTELISSLVFAAKRGIDVSIILPGIQDKKYCRALAYTYYPQLIKAGVKIYHYTPGFIHSKSIVCDDKYAVVGTQNFDFRSLFLHFECGVFFCQTSAVTDVENDFKDTITKSSLFTNDDVKKINLITKSNGRLLRLIAPLL
jgi:cardiolipin synthase